MTRMKQVRDALRVDNNRLKQKGGLVNHPALLGDFEERKDQVCNDIAILFTSRDGPRCTDTQR